MADYTIQLRDVCNIYGRNEVESWFSSYVMSDYLSQEQIERIREASNWTPEKLARKIVDHYYMREIGYETPALFAHFAKVKMNELMESKLPLIWSKYIEFNPLVNVDYVESYTRNIEGTETKASSTTGDETIHNEGENNSEGSTSSTTNTESSGLEVKSDTPQGEISKENILAGSYASSTSANELESQTTSDITSNEKQNTESDSTRSSEGSYSANNSDTRDETFTRTMKGNSRSNDNCSKTYSAI